MSDVATRLRDRRHNVWSQATELAEKAAEENRALSADEESTWQSLNAELDALDKRIKNVIDGEQRAKDTEDAFGKLEGKPQERGSKQSKQSQQTGSSGQGYDPSTGDNVELRQFVTGKSGRYFDVVPQSRVDFRTLSKLTAGAGANTVPTTFYDRLMAHLIETSAMMQVGPTVLNTTGGETVQIPKTTAHSAAAIVTEGAAIAASDPAFGQISLGAYKYGCLIQVSRELLDDTGVDLEGYLSMQAGRALGNALGAHLVTGDGTAKPRGVVTDATTGVTGGAGVVGVPTADGLIDLFYSVIQPYRNSSAAYWLMKDSTLATVRKFKDTTGQYLWQPSYQAGVPDTILGKPVLTDPNVAGTALAAKSVIFGDFSQYFVRLAGGVRFERSDDWAFNTDLTTFRALLRGDGALVDLTGAVKTFVGNAA